MGELGFGAYRITASSEEHKEALVHALAGGVRIIDTSSNYTNGSSEELIGQVLKAHPELQPTVITKAGYAQGNAFKIIEDRASEGRPFADVVEVGENLRHCIHPEFLQYSLETSLTRLQRKHVDVLLLHNPEYFLQVAHQHGEEIQEARSKFYERMSKAFEWMEGARSAGLISSYGVSSNTFGSGIDAPDFVSLAQCLTTAQSVAGTNHGFTHAQMPLNIIEHDVATVDNQDAGTNTTLQCAQHHGIHVITNRPLNAIVGTELIRLATHDIPLHRVTHDSVDARIHELEIAEHEVQQLVMQSDNRTERDAAIIQESFRIASALCQSWNTFEGLIHWRDVRRAYLDNRFAVCASYASSVANNEVVADYMANLGQLLDDVECLYAAEENTSLEELRAAMADEFGLPLDTPLQHVALHAAMCTEGVSTVLVGMRTRDYVNDALAIRSLENTTYHRSTWNRVSSHLARLSS